MRLFERGDDPIDILATAKALFDPVRMKILKLVEEREMCVCELTEVLNISQPRASQHLQHLKRADLVMERRDGKWVYYSINPEKVKEFRALLVLYFDSPDGGIPGFEVLRKLSGEMQRQNRC